MSFRLDKARLISVLIHVAAWVGLAFLPLILLRTANGAPPVHNYVRMVLSTAKLAALFYFNYWVLIPRLLARRYFVAYFVSALALVLLVSLPMSWHYLGFGTPPPLRPGQTFADQRRFELTSILVGVLVWVVSSGLRITGEWFENERLRRQMQSDKLTAELSLLKMQVSPHFLFNTLNNIYSLAQLKSDDAPEAILKLSQLMRYMLYEADTPRVPLAREVEYLHNYVDLQRLRLADDIDISFVTEGQLQGHLIEPMLLIPFVENAFKHGISYQHAAALAFTLQVTDDALLFTAHNRRFGATAPDPASGVGLHNVRQRLELLYPGRHQLRIHQTDHEFLVNLSLQFQHDSVPVS